MKTIGKILKIIGIIVFVFFILVIFVLVFDSDSPKRKYSNVTEMYSTTNLNIREGPSTNYSVLKLVEPNFKLLTADSITNDFIMVLNDDSTRYGWASKKYLQNTPVSDIQIENLKKDRNTESSNKNISNQSTKNNQILKYNVIKQSKVGLATENRATIRIMVLVEELPSDEVMKNTATDIWQNGNNHWDEFTVFIYLPEMDLNYSAYGIIEFTPSGISDFFTTTSNLYGTKWEQK